MPEDRNHTTTVRKHAAIMFTDIVGYTTLMGKDEDGAFDTLKRNHIIHETLINKHNGTLIKEINYDENKTETIPQDHVERQPSRDARGHAHGS